MFGGLRIRGAAGALGPGMFGGLGRGTAAAAGAESGAAGAHNGRRSQWSDPGRGPRIIVPLSRFWYRRSLRFFWLVSLLNIRGAFGPIWKPRNAGGQHG